MFLTMKLKKAAFGVYKLKHRGLPESKPIELSKF